MRTLLYIAAAAGAWWAWNALNEKPSPVTSQTGALSPAEQEYYRQVFDYTMSVTEPGKSYSWKSHGGNGTITPGAVFASKSKAHCREFSERFTIGVGPETATDGIACKREGSEGWCRLRKGQALTCALETPAMIGGAQISGPNVTIPSISAGGNINTGPAPDVQTPGMPAGGGEKPTSGEVADKVTGTAGSAAGSAAHGFKSWFSETFR